MKKIIALPVMLAVVLSGSEQRVFSQMTVVTSPPIQVLNNGYQAPSPFDYQQAGVAYVAPLERAIEANNAARNQFLVNQINNDFALRQQQLQMQANADLQTREIQAQREAEIKNRWRSDRIESATALVRQTADRIQMRTEQGVSAIETHL